MPKNADDAQRTVTSAYYAFGIMYQSENFKRWEQSKGPKFRAYRKAWFDRPAQRDPGPYPLNINIEVTTRCNLACTFCSQITLKKDQIGDMSWEMFKSIADESEQYATPAANINGLGEPLLHKQFPEMVRYIKGRGFLDVMFHTNGSIMSEELADQLIDSGLDRIIFSVDSPDKKTYESMRIRASFDRVVKNVRLFAERRNKRAMMAPIIRTAMVVTDDTVHQVQDYLKLWKPVADQVTLQDMSSLSKRLDDGTWANQEKSPIPASFDEVRDAAKKKKVGFACPYLFQAASPFWNGDVIPCCNPNAREHLVMGRLGPETMHGIWNGKKYTELRKLHVDGRWHEHPLCGYCEIPMIELYKTLTKEGVKFSGSSTAPSSLVAEDHVPKDGSASDLALELQKKAGEPHS
jgi:wyosine [tRNA(Phe)-imidazoG37] synthetase (radical SAM superfamily)